MTGEFILERMDDVCQLHMLSTTVIYAPLFARWRRLSVSGRSSIDISVRVEGSSAAVVRDVIAIGHFFKLRFRSDLAADERENADEENGSEEVSEESVAVSEEVGGIVAASDESSELPVLSNPQTVVPNEHADVEKIEQVVNNLR